jgi:putative thioredoxin
LTSQHVITTTAATFETDVINASHERPVLVDFWAEWCGPCKAIAPVLEQLADEFNGDLVVAKVDTDVEQQLAQVFGIRSLPTMVLFRDGKPAEQIVGAQPGAEIRKVIERFLPQTGNDLLGGAIEALAAGELEIAERLLREALAADETNYAVHPLLATVLIRQGRLSEVEEMLAALPINISTDASFDPIRAQLHLASFIDGESNRESLETLAADAENISARFELSVLQALSREFEPALETLIELIIRHRAWKDGVIHKVILDVFNVMAHDDPLLKRYRTQLARTLN